MSHRCRFHHSNARAKLVNFSGIVLLAFTLTASAQDNVTLGIELFNQGQFDQAEAKLMEALKEQPRSAEIYFYLGMVASKKGEQARAVAAYRRAEKLDPEMEGVQLSAGIAYYRMGLNELAIRSFKRATKQDPKDASAPFFLGLSYEQTGQYDQAIDWFEQAAALDPEFEQQAYFNIGVAEAGSGDSRAARKALQRAIAIDPNSETGADAQNYLATLERGGPEPKRWYVSANAGFEYDDNVTLSTLDNTTGIEDAAAVFDFAAAYQLYKTDSSEIEVGYDLYQSVYKELSDFDLQSHLFSAMASHEFGKVDANLGYSYNYIELGGESFLEIQSVTPSIGFSSAENLYHTLSYNFKDKNFTSNSARDADHHAIGLDNYYFFSESKSYAYVNLRFEDEDTTAPEFDYNGYYVTVGGKTDLPIFARNPELRFSYQYFLRDYLNPNPALGEEREDVRNTITLSLTQYLNDIFNVQLNYQYLDSNSNLQTSDYTENIVSMTIGARF